MRASQFLWKDLSGWVEDPEQPRGADADLVLYFGSRAMLGQKAHFEALKNRFPAAQILGCSTGGQMAEGDVTDEQMTALVIDFANTQIQVAEATVRDPGESHAAGAAIGAELAGPDLAGIFILSDGLHVNGSALVEGVVEAVGAHVPVSGGLAGDG